MARMIKAGELDRVIVIQRLNTVTDDFGAEIPTPVTLASVRAKATPVSDGERWRAGEVAANVSHRFVIRWTPTIADITAKDQIVFEGRSFDISGVKEIGRREGFEITASARAD